MDDTAGIKRKNKKKIWKLLISGKSFTKQQIALQTGLSVASCNTYLNEMEISGQVIGEKQKSHDVGRNAVVYKINEDFESILCIYFELIQGVKSIKSAVFSLAGKFIYQHTHQYETLNFHAIEEEMTAILNQFSNVSYIMVGTPSIAENGVIRHSDISELENLPVKHLLEEKFHKPVFLANDMHYKVYGYYRQEQISDKIVTLINYPAGVLPGTATVHKGILLTGKNLFAGMVGFLDFDMTREEQIKRLQRSTAEPLITKAVIALISILNPHELLFTGDLLQKDDLQHIMTACKKCIPEDYMPDFVFLSNTDEYYLKGMYWTAIDRKEKDE